MGTAGSIVLDLLARTGSFETDLQRAARTADREAKRIAQSARQHAQETERAWSTASRAVTTVLGAMGAGAIFTRLIQNTKNASDEQAQLAAVLRSTGQAAGWSAAQLNDMAATMSRASTASAGEISKAQVTLLAFTGIAGDQFPRALQAAMDMAARTGMTVSSAAESIGRALDVPSQGLTALSRQGFRFTEEQKRLAKQLEDTGRTAEAQGIILGALEESYGGAAQAARHTLGGALTALNNSLDDLLTGSTEAFQPIVSGIESLNDLLASGHAEKALKALTYAAIGVSAILAGRLLASLGGSAAGFIAATAEAARYQMTLASMAGVSRAAAAGIGGLTAVTRAGSLALGILGGPVGLAATLGITAAAFVAMGSGAKVAALDVDALSQSIASLNREQLALRQQQAGELFDRVTAEAEDAARALAAVERDYEDLQRLFEQGRGVDAEGLANVNKTLVVLRAELADANQKVAEARALQDRLADAARNAAGGVTALNGALSQTNDAGAKYLERLADQSLLAGLTTQRKQLDALVEAGKLLFTPDDLKKAQDYADKIDRVNRSMNASKSADPLASFRARLAGAQELTAALQQYGLQVDELLPAERELLKLQGQMGLAVKDRVGKTSDATLAAQVALTKETAAQEKLAKALRQTLEMRQEYLDSILDQNAAVYTSITELEDRAATFAMTDEETARNVEALAQARVRERIAVEEANLARQRLNAAGEDEIATTEKALAGLRQQLEYREREAELNERLRRQMEERRQFERTVSEWTNTVREIDDVFRQGFADMLNEGEGSWKAFTQSLATTFKTTVADTLYKAFAQPIIVRVVAEMAGLISGPGVAQQVLQQAGVSQGGSLLGGANLFGGGSIAGSVTKAADYLGYKLWESGFTETGNALASSAQSLGKIANSAGQVLGYGKAIYDLTQGNYGSAVGTAIGTYILPGIGTAIGSALGGMLDGMFGGETRFGAGYTIDTATGRSYRSGGPSGGDPNAANTQAAIDAMWATTDHVARMLGGSVAGLGFAGGLEISPDKGNSFVWSDWVRAGEANDYKRGMTRLQGVKDAETVIAEFAVEMQRAVIDGLKMADIDQEFADWLNQFDTSALDSAGVQGVLAMLDAIIRLRDVAADMGLENLASAAAGAQARIIELSGGLDALGTNLQSYQQNFFSQEEQLETVRRQLAGVFGDLGLAMPETNAGFRSLVEGLDLSTEAGQQAYATLLSINGAFAELTAGSEALAQAAIAAAEEQARAAEQARQAQQTAINAAMDAAYQMALAARQAAESAAYGAMDAVRRAVDAERARIDAEFQAQAAILNARISASQTVIGNLDALAGRLQSTLDGMLRTYDPVMSRMQGQQQIAAALALARSSGVLPQAADLDAALQAVAGPTEGMFSSFEEYQLDFLRTAHDIAALNAITGDQLTTEERALAALREQLDLATALHEDEMARLDRIIEQAQMELDIAMGTYQGVLSIEAALAGLQSAILQLARTPAPSPPGAGGDPVTDMVAGWYRDIYGWQDAAGQAYWEQQVRDRGAQQALDDFLWSGRNNGTLPSFAVGTNFVPTDMVAQIHRGERIIPAADNAELMAHLSQPAALVEELRGLRRQLEGMERLQREGVTAAKATADILDQNSAGGGPLLVEIA